MLIADDEQLCRERSATRQTDGNAGEEVNTGTDKKKRERERKIVKHGHHFMGTFLGCFHIAECTLLTLPQMLNPN